MTSYEDFAALSQGSVDSVVKANTAAAKGFETMTKYFASYAGKAFEDAVAVSKKFTSVKTLVEFLQLQTKLAEEALGTFVAEAKAVSEMSTEIMKNVTTPLTGLYKSTLGMPAKAPAPAKKAA